MSASLAVCEDGDESGLGWGAILSLSGSGTEGATDIHRVISERSRRSSAGRNSFGKRTCNVRSWDLRLVLISESELATVSALGNLLEIVLMSSDINFRDDGRAEGMMNFSLHS